MLILQIPPPPGVDPLVGWIIIALLSALSTVFFLWQRQTAAESKRKDELIDRLLRAGLEDADTTRRSVSLLEEERRRNQ